MKDAEYLVGLHISDPVAVVAHSRLTRADSDSPHKSICPVCKEGFLLMRRNPETLFLSKYDNCCLCGQQFEYSDVEDNKTMSL